MGRAPGCYRTAGAFYVTHTMMCAYSNTTEMCRDLNPQFVRFAGKTPQSKERRSRQTDEAGHACQTQRGPGCRNRRSRTSAPDRQVTVQSLTNRQSRAGTENAACGRKHAQGRGTGDHHAGTGCEASTRRTGERRCPEHYRRWAAGADSRINTGSAADTNGAAGGEHRRHDGRYWKRRAVPGACEGHDAGERKRM